jgi:hypothetical protein
MRRHSSRRSSSSGGSNRILAASPADQRGIDAGVEVGREDRDPAEALDSLQQIVDLQVRVAIDGALDLGTLGEQSVGFVEEDHQRGPVGDRDVADEVADRDDDRQQTE